MSTEKLERATTRLIARSIRAYSNPHRLFAWPAKPPTDTLAMTEALLPLAGHPLFKELSDEQRWRLALMEAVNFFSLNIAGERDLMTGLAQRLYCRCPANISHYLQHFLHEENAHTVVFARFCLDYGGIIYPDRQLRFPRDFRPGEEEFLFFARVLIFEEIAHFYNKRVAVDEGVWKIARDIHRYHAEDESRHIAFGRLLVEEMWERFGAHWTVDDKTEISDYLTRYTASVLRSYVNPSVHQCIGPETMRPELRDEVLASAHWIALATESTAAISKWLERIGVVHER